jgi:hypothetical protein
MAKSLPNIDRRLLGTWKSDRRRTFRHFRPKAGCSPASFRKFRALFGKLVIRWGHGKSYAELDGHRSVTAYEVVASDSRSVVIRYFDSLAGEDRLRQIHFDGEYYWIALGGGLCEYFRRMQVSDEAADRR